MVTKMFEVRDRATRIICIGTLMVGQTDQEAYGCRATGYGRDNPLVVLTRIDNLQTEYDGFGWGENPRTMMAAHQYISDNWLELDSGDVVDVEFIEGETTKKKDSDRWYDWSCGEKGVKS